MTDKLSARQLLDHLVSFPTVSSDTNLPLIHFVRDYFVQHGIDSVVFPSEDGNKAGLVAQVGPNVAGGRGRAQARTRSPSIFALVAAAAVTFSPPRCIPLNAS